MSENQNRIFEQIKAGTESIIPQEELHKKLAKKRPLKVKLGADPTSPDLHIGHAVPLLKLRQFQDLGHEVIFLIGDFTARIGDPTEKSKTRPMLTDEQIAYNTKTYFKQVSKIIDPEKVTICYNSTWLGKVTSAEFVKLCAQVTLARLIERDDFKNRITEQQPIGFHELLYPLLQGYDSVALEADIELGGTDQTFNLLMGRHLQEHYGQEPQVIITLPLLEGLDGVAKMSKSLGNAIGLNEPADQAFGKLMSISDTLMWRYYAVLLHKTDEQLRAMQDAIAAGSAHPMALKKELAYAVIARFWGELEAVQAQNIFENLFQKKDLSHAEAIDASRYLNTSVWIIDFLKFLGVVSSSEARRLIEAGAVAIDNNKITDAKAQIMVASGLVIKIGKHRFYRIK